VGFGVVHLALSRGLRLYAAFLAFRSACASLRLCSRVSDIAGSSGVTGSGSGVHRRDRVVEPDEPATSFVTSSGADRPKSLVEAGLLRESFSG
jgi:hypothetical protein